MLLGPPRRGRRMLQCLAGDLPRLALRPRRKRRTRMLRSLDISTGIPDGRPLRAQRRRFIRQFWRWVCRYETMLFVAAVRDVSPRCWLSSG